LTLQEKVESLRRQIATDSYPMSIGELANLYRDEELDVHPEFQRVFRWSDLQKSRLIESILLGIPLPSIFVAQNEKGIWDVVDGVQRLSTIFEFMGIFRDDTGQLVPPFRCVATEFLPELAGRTFEGSSSETSLDMAQRLDFKRSKLDLKIIKRESDPRAKYDLFQRLNSYGSQATPQELRNCLLVSINKEMYEWLQRLSQDSSFVKTIDLSEKNIDEQYDTELALRFIVLHKLDVDNLTTIDNIGDFLTASLIRLTEKPASWRQEEEEVFRRTFSIIEQQAGVDAFRKWNEGRQRFEGTFSLTSFEVIALGIGYHMSPDFQLNGTVPDKAREFWTNPQFAVRFATGLSADRRMRRTIPTGRALFAPAQNNGSD
jgi:hypothetical protein